MAQQMRDLKSSLIQNLNTFQCQWTTTDYHDTPHITEIIEHSLIIGHSAQRCYARQVCARTGKVSGACACGKQQAVVTNLLPALQMDVMLINLDIHHTLHKEAYLVMLVKTPRSHPEFFFRYSPCEEILEQRAIVHGYRVVGDDGNVC